MKANGLVARYSMGEAIVNDRAHYIEKAFRECHKAGYCDDDGAFTKSMPEDRFKEYYKSEIVEEKDGVFKFTKS